MRSTAPSSATCEWLLVGESPTLVEKCNRYARANTLGEVKGVPIGESDAAMGLGLTDTFRMRRPMNSITCLGQIDPDQADRIVGTGRDGKFSISPHALELKLGIVMIGGVLDNPADAVSAAWCRFLAAADRCRIESDQFAVAPERANDFGWLVDLNPGNLTIRPISGDVGTIMAVPARSSILPGLSCLINSPLVWNFSAKSCVALR